MAKKKEEKLKFLQMPLTNVSVRSSKLTKVDWSGLNRRHVIDSGEISEECNISTVEAPYLVPSPLLEALTGTAGELKYEAPISMFGFGDFLVVIYFEPLKNNNGVITRHDLMADFWRTDKDGELKEINGVFEKYTGRIKQGITGYETELKRGRSMAQFNVYDGIDVLNGSYVKKLLLFPDKISMNFKVETIEGSPNKEAHDIHTMYYDSVGKEFYVWNGSSFTANSVLVNGEKCFIADSLDVPVWSYYNDGFIKASGVCKRGYFKTADTVYNANKEYFIFVKAYNLLKLSGLKAQWKAPVISGDVSVEVNGIVISGGAAAALPETGDSVVGYYECSVDDKGNKTYFKTTDKVATVETVNEKERVKDYYRYFTEDTYVPITEIIRDIADKMKFPEKYEILEYSTEDEDTVYYKRLGKDYPYEYEEVEVENGDNVSGYWIDAKKYEPSDDVVKAAGTAITYFYNTCKRRCYIKNEAGEWIETANPNCPNLKYVTTHLSRLCGVDDSRVYVSGSNDYTNWALDDAIEDDNASGAWVSTSQSDSKKDGNFTGITTYDGHVVCFKKDYMHEVYGTKNPFRLYDIYADGTIDNRSICEVAGRLIFVSENGVKVYTGSAPKEIGYKLGVDKFSEAVAGSDGRCYYLYCVADKEEHLFVYDTLVGEWSERALPELGKGKASVINFAHNDCGMYMLCTDGMIYRLDTDEYNGQKWSFKTDLFSNKSVDIKHLRKIQLMAEFGSGSSLEIYGVYDNSDRRNSVGKHDGVSKEVLLYTSPDGVSGRHAIRIKPRKTANYGFKLRFEGEGYVKLYQMEIGITGGGEQYV